MSSNLIGKVLLNRFGVDAFIASGGMGAVYRVWDQQRNVPLAMKVLHAELAEDPSILKKFQREARALKKLAHPNIVQFYGLYQTLDFAFLLERFIDGPSLKAILHQQKGKPLPVADALSYLKALCAALGYAHASGVVHCDVKPGNVMVDRGGNIYLTDFGVARHAESTTTTLGMAGTPAYMAPEQIRGKAVVPATDVYALGVILFEMLTGQRPFRGVEEGTEKSGATAHERIRYGHLHLPPPDPLTINPAIPPALVKVILKAICKEPTERYRSARDFFTAVCAAVSVTPEEVADRIVVPDLPTAPDYSSGREVIPPSMPATTRGPARPVLPWVLGGGMLFIVLGGVATVVILAIMLFSGDLGRGQDAPNPPATISTYTPSPTSTPRPKSTPLPTFLVRPYDSSKDQNAECVICRVAGWEGTKTPGHYSWNVTFPANTPAEIRLGWCATDKQTLVSNWIHMEYELVIDNYRIDLARLELSEIEGNDGTCYSYAGVLTGWSIGHHTYTWIHHIYQSVHDGWDLYPSGDYIFEFIVDVQ